MNSNQHIIDYLDYYINLETSPEFAVLIRGVWGVGKTHLVKKIIVEQEKNGKKFLKVSLYGLNSTVDIDHAIFAQLHPLLASKGMKLAGQVLKGVLKTTVNIDLNKDGSKDGSLSPQIPDISPPEYFKNTDSKVLIFDDLERCLLPISVVMGYLNQLVESKGLKVVIIANEEELYANDQNKEGENKYSRVKEKVIGKSLDVVPNFTEAFDAFLSNSKIKEFLIHNKESIQEIYQAAGYNNLRHLRQTLLDLDHFFTFLTEKIKIKKEAITQIVKLFLISSFEIKSGQIAENDLYFLLGYLPSAEIKSERAQKFRRLQEKYFVQEIKDPPFLKDLWVQFFKTGSTDTKLLEESILRSRYFYDETTPAWRRLWDWYNDDGSFEKYYSEVLKSLQTGEIHDPFVLTHVVGMFIEFSNSFNVLSLGEVMDMAYKNADRLGVLGLVPNRYSVDVENGAFQLGFYARDTMEMRSFINYMSERGRTYQEQRLPERAKDLIALLENNYVDFCKEIQFLSNYNDGLGQLPVFKFADKKTFCKLFLQCDTMQKRWILKSLRARYGDVHRLAKLYKEKDWWMQVVADMKNEVELSSNPVRKLVFAQEILPVLEEIVMNLSSYSPIE